MDLRDVELFIAVVERGGFRAAADALHLSQGAVSRRVQQLELELGVLLMARTFPVAPTPAGQELYARVAPLVGELRAALSETRTKGGRRLHVGYISPAIVSLVPALLEVLRVRRPAPEVELHELPGAEVRAGLQSGRLALGFLLEEASDSKMEFLALRDFRYALALPASDPLAQRRFVSASELGDRTLLTLARHEPVHARILEQLLAASPALGHQDAFGFSEIQHLVASGLGFAAVPSGFMADPPPGIAVVDVDPPLPMSTIGMAAPRPMQGELLASCFSAMGRRFGAAEEPVESGPGG